MTRSTRNRSTSKNNIGLWLVGSFALIVAIMVILLVVNSNRATKVDTAIYDDIPAEWINGNAIGDPEAVVTIRTYEDFMCPHCQRWSTTIKEEVVEQFVKTGQARLVFQYFPLNQFEPAASMGAMASACAAEQGAFWPYHDLLFQLASTQGAGVFTLDKLTQHANSLDLNVKNFTQCMSSQQSLGAVRESTQLGIADGVGSTPTIVINGVIFPDAFDINAMADEIARLNAAANGG